MIIYIGQNDDVPADRRSPMRLAEQLFLCHDLARRGLGCAGSSQAAAGGARFMTATTLEIGDLGLIGVNTEDTIPGGSTANDQIGFLLLAPIGAGTTIYFTDRAWNGTTFTNAAGDGTF